MTRTEDRLADALQKSAARVRDDRLRPFPPLEPRTRRRPAWPAWLIPVAAAASVVLVIGLVALVTGGPRPATGAGRTATSPAGGTSVTTADLPGFYAMFSPGGSVAVRSTATGAVTGTLHAPTVPGNGWLIPGNLTAAPGDRTFYVEYDVYSPTRPQIWIYRLSITSSGSVTAVSRVRGGTIPGSAGYPDSAGLGNAASLVVSPDGTQLALTVNSKHDIGTISPAGYADKIMIVDLRTGTQTVWQGGLYRSGKTFSISSLSWATDGKSLVYLALWCDTSPLAGQCAGGGSGVQTYRATQVRSLAVTTGGGSLLDGTLLFGSSARYPVIAGVLAGPDGDLTLLVLSGRQTGQSQAALVWSRIAVERVSADGSLLGVDYRGLTQGSEGQPQYVTLSADPGGRYLLLLAYDGQDGTDIGWIGQGGIHLLMPHYSGNAVTAW